MKPLMLKWIQQANEGHINMETFSFNISYAHITSLKDEGKLVTPVFQYVTETILPHLVQKMLTYTDYDREEWALLLETLYYCCYSSTTAINYALSYPDLLKTVITMMTAIAQSSHHASLDKEVHVINDCDTSLVSSKTGNEPDIYATKSGVIKSKWEVTDVESVESTSIFWSLKVLNICSIGSKRGNTELWNDILSDLDFTKVLKAGSMAFQFSELINFMVGSLRFSLQVLHSCHVKTPDTTHFNLNRKRFEGNHLQFTDNDDPISRLELVLRICNLTYGVFCSHCGKKDPTNHSFPKCARCKITRYCDTACQKRHWKEKGHNLVCKTTNRTLVSKLAKEISSGAV